MKYLYLILLLVSLPAWATDWRNPEQNQAQDQSQSQSQSANGGNVGGLSSQSRVYALAGNITQVQVSDCYIPAKRFGRSQNYLWGLFSLSGVVALDPDCVAAKVAIIDAQTRLLEAQNEAKRIERLEAEVSEQRETEAYAVK